MFVNGAVKFKITISVTLLKPRMLQDNCIVSINFLFLLQIFKFRYK